VGYDPVRWGPILAGVALTFLTFVALSLLAVGIGLGSAASGGAAPTTAGQATNQIARAGEIVAGVIGLIAFFLGGWIAGRWIYRGGPMADAARCLLVQWRCSEVDATHFAEAS
jgi:hypothetical protein